MAKQSALMVGLPLITGLVLLRGWRSLSAAATFFGLLILSTLVMQWLHDGWYYFYVFDLPKRHAIAREQLLGFWIQDVAATLALPTMAIGISVIYGVIAHRAWLFRWPWSTTNENPTAERRRCFWFWSATMAGGVLAAWASRLHSGGYVNVLMPMHVAIAMLTGLGLGYLRHHRETSARVFRLTITVMLIGQLLLWSSPSRWSNHIPSPEDQQMADRLVARIRQAEGPVLIPYHGYLNHMAGKSMNGQHMAVMDVLRCDLPPGVNLDQSYKDALENQVFDLIVLDHPIWYEDQIAEYYQLESIFLEKNSDVMMPVTGNTYRPRMFYVPKHHGSR